MIVKLKLFDSDLVTLLESLGAGNEGKVLVLLELGDDFQVGLKFFVDAEEDYFVPLAAIIGFHESHLLGNQVRF